MKTLTSRRSDAPKDVTVAREDKRVTGALKDQHNPIIMTWPIVYSNNLDDTNGAGNTQSEQHLRPTPSFGRFDAISFNENGRGREILKRSLDISTRYRLEPSE